MTQDSPDPQMQASRSDIDPLFDCFLSDFFKSQMKSPWPSAPATPTLINEASLVLAAQKASREVSNNRPAFAGLENGNRSRYTLAASVALFLGTCWYLSNGFDTSIRPRSLPIAGDAIPSIKDATAGNPDPLLKLREDKATGGNGLPSTKLKLP